RPVFDAALSAWSTTRNSQDNHATSFIAYDENGAAHTVTLKYNIRPPVGTLAHWVVTVESTDTATGNADTSATWSSLLNTADLYFNGDGSLNSASDSTIIIDPYNTTVGNINFPINWGTLNAYDGIVQFEGDSSARSIDVTGYAAGELQNITVNDTGLVTGNFTNGRNLVLAQIALYTFDNPGGLEKSGGNNYLPTLNSGGATDNAPGTGGSGTLVPSALEGSNVDLAEQFVNLITAQRGFQSNARVITTANDMLGELVSIAR
ncbi:MAG: flagellar hook-basal body complex protein, partial [Candidatus Aureabacteria bacterium]|nr:flagellar hook-basal body complex protein [Candidatus Auribacterota bacterium]